MRRRAGAGKRSLRSRIFERALLRELRRMRQLLEMEDTAYSDLAVLKRAREELQELAADDERSRAWARSAATAALQELAADERSSELEEDELLDDED